MLVGMRRRDRATESDRDEGTEDKHLRRQPMRIAVAAVLAAAGSCAAQTGLYGVSRNGDLSRINPDTGERTHLGNLGVEAVAAAAFGARLYVLTPQGRLVYAGAGGTTVLGELNLIGK